MWGVYIFAGAAGSSMSLLVLVITALRKAGYLKDTITIEHYHIMGKWMLAFTVFWAYIGFSQYMLIWYANIPEETEWFIRRNTESWNALNLFLVIGRFFVPFALLLLRAPKKSPRKLCLIAGWIIFMQLRRHLYRRPAGALSAGLHISIWDFLPLIGMGATLGLFLSAHRAQDLALSRIAIPACWNLFAQLINRDARRTTAKIPAALHVFDVDRGGAAFCLFRVAGAGRHWRVAARRQLRGEAGQGPGREAASRARGNHQGAHDLCLGRQEQRGGADPDQ